MAYLIEINKINTILVKTSEKILPSSLKDFCLSNLKIHNIKIFKNSKIFYTYLENSKHYQISTFISKNDSFLLELELICLYMKDKKKDVFYLYLYEDIFVLIKNKSLIYYEKNSNTMPLSEFSIFVEKKFLINIYKEEVIKKNEILEYKDFYNKKDFVSTFNFLENRHKINYSLYLLIFFLFSSLAFLYNESYLKSKNENSLVILEEEYKTLGSEFSNREFVSIKILNILNEIKNNNIKINNLNLANKKFSINISSKKIEVLYKFIALYKNSVITLIKRNGVNYEMDAKIYL